jgi:5'-methylthioadenosine phosphorylase
MQNNMIGIIAGTGLAASLTEALNSKEEITDANVAFGDRAGSVVSFTRGKFGSLEVFVIPRHGPTVAIPDRSPAELVRVAGHEAHIWMLHSFGVRRVYGFNSVGAVDRTVPLASENAFLVPNQFGRGFGASLHSFGRLALDIHPSMAEPFCPVMRERLLNAIRTSKATALDRGLYIHSAGDAFETAAEVDAYRILYQNSANKVVGMTSGAEIVLCKQLKMEFALLCANCNWAQGHEQSESVTHEHVLEGMRPATGTLQTIAMNLIRIEAEQFDE